MALTVSKVTELAPDQESLQAASKLRHPSKWPQLTKNGELVWENARDRVLIRIEPYLTIPLLDTSVPAHLANSPANMFLL